MPTGYTYKITDKDRYPNFTPKDFILGCAEQFAGYKDTEQEIYDSFKTSIQYHQENLVKAEERLAQEESKAREDYIKEIEELNERSLRSYNKSIMNVEEMVADYDKFIEAVVAWEVPTENHKGLKDFCLQQLEASKKHDAYKPLDPFVFDINDEEQVNKYIRDSKKHIQDNIDYHKVKLDELFELREEAIKWRKDLIESLKEM